MKILLLAGQSNNYFGAGYDPALDSGDARILQFPSSGADFSKVVSGNEPLTHHTRLAASIGHGHRFAKSLLPRLDPDDKILIVPAAMGSTGFNDGPNGTWKQTNATPSGGVNFATFAVQQVLKVLALNPANEMLGIIWHQGEADSTSGSTRAAYEANLDSLFNYFRTEIPGAADVPIVVGQLLPERIEIVGPVRQGINAAHVDTPRRLTRTAFTYGPSGYAIPNAEGTGPSEHYNAAGQRIFADRTLASWDRALANVAGAPPVAPAEARAVAGSGDTVLVDWDQPVSRVTSFVVQQKIGTDPWTTVAHTGLDVTKTLTRNPAVDFQVRIATVNETGTSATTLAPRIVGAGGTPPPSGGPVAFTDNGDGTVTFSGDGVTDNNDGTATISGSNVVDNNDGTFTTTV